MEPISLWSSLARAMTSSRNVSLASSARAGHSLNAATYSIPIQGSPKREKREREKVRSSVRISTEKRVLRIIIKRQGIPSATYLAIEGDWRLIEPGLLRIPDIRRDDLVEGQVMGSVRLELHAVFLGFNGQLTTHGILDVENRRI